MQARTVIVDNGLTEDHLLLLHLFLLLCGVDVWYTPPCSTVIHFVSRQSLLFDVILHIVQPSSLRSSSLPSPLYFHFHHPPSDAVLLSSHHMPIPPQPPFLDFLCDFPHFRCPSYSFISYLVQLRNERISRDNESGGKSKRKSRKVSWR